MGGRGSGRVGRKPYEEQLAIEELLQYSITTLKRVLTSPDVSDDKKAQIALVLASRRVSNKQETRHIVELTSQEQGIIDKYSKPIQHNTLDMITGSTATGNDMDSIGVGT